MLKKISPNFLVETEQTFPKYFTLSKNQLFLAVTAGLLLL
jgi:hypothetical protein